MSESEFPTAARFEANDEFDFAFESLGADEMPARQARTWAVRQAHIKAQDRADEATGRTALLFSGAFEAYPYPGFNPEWDEAAMERAQGILNTILALDDEFGEHIVDIDLDGDYEDFWENAARYAAALRAGAVLGRPVLRKEAGAWTEDQMARRLGPVNTSEETSHDIDPLTQNELLARHGGRFIMAATLYDELTMEADDLVRIIMHRAAHGVSHVVLKNAERKGGIWTIPTSEDPERARAAVWAAEDGWTMVRLAGRKGGFIIQDHVPMQYEYRTIAVDGQLVTAAGNIEEFTPMNRREADGSFSPLVRQRRGNGVAYEEDSEVIEHKDLTDKMLLKATQIAAEHGGTVTIDMAIVNGEPVLVELNPTPNSGLFATDVDALYLALAGAKDRGYTGTGMIHHP